MSCLLSSMPLSTYARNRYLYTYHRIAYVYHRVHSSLLQSIKTAITVMEKKLLVLNFSSFLLIVCKIIVVAIATNVPLPLMWSACLRTKFKPQQQQIINLSYTNKLTQSQVWSAYHISVYQIYRMGGEPLRETERQKSTLMYKHILSYQ